MTSTLEDVTSVVDADDTGATAAIAAVRRLAHDTLFGRYTALPIDGRRGWYLVNRIGATGLMLRGGWTFLVQPATARKAKNTVVRTTVPDPENLDYTDARRRAFAITELN